ncbi:MAG: hypothetical protein HOV68_09670 [Streptomycetaceae bacterium]|nr:hypothetical protein [Streptomycetaceae bacterium]
MFAKLAPRRWVWAAGAAVLSLGVAGCGGSGSSSALKTSSPTASVSAKTSKSPGNYEYQLRSFGNANVAFSLRLGPGESVEESSRSVDASLSATAPLQLILERDGDPVAAITAYRADAPLPYRNTGLGNGRHGVYRTTADIPAEELASATHVVTPLGDATVFTHPYYECTNSCKNWTVPVAVITLTRPKTPDYPTLVIASDHAELDLDGLREVLGRLAP